LLRKRDESELVGPLPEEDRLDGLARGVADDTISRGQAIKLAGAALAGSALSLFAVPPDDAEARVRRRQRVPNTARRRIRRLRRRCRRKTGFRFCKDRVDGTTRTRCCRQPTSNRRCRRGRC
jgi:hypothetical protein